MNDIKKKCEVYYIYLILENLKNNSYKYKLYIVIPCWKIKKHSM
jgi:hypothetical protein